MAFFSMARYTSVMSAWLEFLVDLEAVEGSHQGTNYSFKDCLVSSIFYWRYGVERLSPTKAPSHSPRPSIQSSASREPPFIRLISVTRL